MLEAAFWGWVTGAALVLGAFLGYFSRLPRPWIAAIMAFGSGILMAALSFDLFEEAYARGGALVSSLGFLTSAVFYTIPNWYLEKRGAQSRKQTGGQQPAEDDQPGSGLAIALGASLDGIPESLVIGLSLLHGRRVSMVAVIAIFLSNIPEGLASAAGLREAGSPRYALGLWGVIALALGIVALVGYVIFQGVSPDVIAASLALGAGAILTMIVHTMIPEAFAVTQHFSRLIAVTGFLLAFLLSKVSP
ncbi:ZIP family metal transporter [Nitrospira sp. Nam74]